MIEKITPRKLNTSKDARIQGAMEMYDAYNISVSEFDGAQDSGAGDGTSSGTQTGDQGVIKPAKGNSALVDGFGETEATRRIIGSVTDEVNGVIFCFLFSTAASEQGVYIITDDALAPIYTSAYFNFPSTGFVRADIVYHKGEPILYFTDGVNEPRKLNVQKASEVDYDTASEIVDFITACPKTPMHRPTFSFDSNPNKPTNFRNVEGFQFAYQCVYDTGEESAISTYSNIAVPPSYLNQGALSEPSLISDNVINISIPDEVNGVKSFTENIKKVRLLVRIGGRGGFFEVEEKDYFPQAGGVFFNFSNDSVITAIPEEDILKLNDALPKRAEAQAVVNDRLMYGNYTEGFDEIDDVSCSLDVFFNERGEEFTDLEIGIKKVILPVGYDNGVNIQYDSNLKSTLGTDSAGNALIHNRRSSYQFDVSGLPSSVPEGTEMRIRLNIRPDRNFEIYDSRNSFHTFKNRGYDTGASDADSASKNQTTITIKNMDGNDSDMPSVAQFNKGVVLEGVGWTALNSFDHTSQTEAQPGGVLGEGNKRVSTGHSPSCPFIIPTTSFDFKLGLRFTEAMSGESQVKSNITNALINYLTFGELNPSESAYTVDDTIELIYDSSQSTARSELDQGMNNSDGYGRITESDPRAQTVMQLFNYEDIDALNTSDHLLSQNHPGAIGFVSMNKARVSANLLFNEAATNAVSTTLNDVGPIFSINISEITGSNGTGNPEYHTMIPRIMPDGSKGWWWASRNYMSTATDGDVFVQGEHSVSGVQQDPVEGTILAEVTTNKNLWFSLQVPLPMGGQWNNFVTPAGDTQVFSDSNFFNEGVVDQSIYEDFNYEIGYFEQYQQAQTCSSLVDRYLSIGYLSDETPLLQIVSTRGNYSENNSYQKYSVVDGETNVRRSKAFGDRNQNFFYGILFGTEYAGKQNRQFPLSRGWDGSGDYPGVLSGKFDYAYTNNADLIDSEIESSTVQQIVDGAYPDVEVKSFSTSVSNISPSEDPQARSFKRYCSHDFGVVFYDERGRAGNVYPLGSVFVDGYDSNVASTGSAFVTASFDNTASNIPDYARFYKIVYGGNSTISDFTQYTAGGAFIPSDSLNEEGLIYVSLNYLQENNLVSYSKAFGAVGSDGDKDLYTYSEGDRLRIISYFENDDERIFVNDDTHNFDVVGTVTLGETENPLVGDNEDVHPAKTGQFVILKNNSQAQGFRYEDVSQSPALGAGTNTENIYNSATNFWNKRCVFEIYSPIKKKEAEDRIYHEIGKTYNIVFAGGTRKYQTPNVIVTEGDVFFRKAAVNMQSFVGNNFVGLIGNGNGISEESIEPNFKSYYLESNTFTDRFPGADVKPYGKPRTVSRVRDEVKRTASIKFSDKANPASNIVRYTSFNDSKLPFKDLQNNDGPINALLNFNDSLFCIQQLKASSIPVSRTLLADALGNETVIGTSKVLGTEKYYAGTYGTNHPESVTKVDNFVYFASSDFKQIYRFNPSKGIEVISDRGMGSFFESQLSNYGSNPRVVGGYDPENDEFVLSINSATTELVSEGVQGQLGVPSGSILEDSIETFIGAVGGVSTSTFDDSAIADIIGSISQAEDAIRDVFDSIAGSFDSFQSIETILTADFTEEASEGTSVTIDVAGTEVTIGPFANASSYNSQLAELQASIENTLRSLVEASISSYANAEGLFENSAALLTTQTANLKSQLEVIRQLVESVPELLTEADDDTLALIVQQIAGEAGQSKIDGLNTLIDSVQDLIDRADVVDAHLKAGSATVIDQEYVLTQLGIEGIDLGVDSSISVQHLTNIEGESVTEFLSSLSSDYQAVLSAVGGSVDTSNALSLLFAQTVSNATSISNSLQDALNVLYGEDGVEGTADDLQNLLAQAEIDRDNALIAAYGADMTADGVGGLEGQLVQANANNQIFIDEYNNLFQEWGQLYANIEGSGTYTTDGLTTVTELLNSGYFQAQIDVPGYDSAAPVNEFNEYGQSYKEAVGNLLTKIDELNQALEDAPTDADVAEVETLKKQRLNAITTLEMIVGEVAGLNMLGSGFFNGQVTQLQGVVNTQLNSGTLSEDGEEVDGFNPALFVNTVQDFIQKTSLPIPTLAALYNVVFGQIVNPGTDTAIPEELLYSVPGANARETLRDALVDAISDQLLTGLPNVGNDETRTVQLMSQYLAAWNTISNNSPGLPEDFLLPGAAVNVSGFAGQTINPIVETVIEEVEVEVEVEVPTTDLQLGFAALLQLLSSGQLDELQVKEIIDLLNTDNNINKRNNEFFVDYALGNKDGEVGTADLLDFLVTYGNPAPLVGSFGAAPIGGGLPQGDTLAIENIAGLSIDDGDGEVNIEDILDDQSGTSEGVNVNG